MLQDELAAALGMSKGQLSKLKGRGCPIDDVGKARVWITSHIKPRAKRNRAGADPVREAVKNISPAETPPPDPCETWEARLGRARKIERDIYNASQAAIGRKEYTALQSLLSSYQRALQGIAEAERTALDTRTQTGELIHRDTARQLIAEVIVPIRNALELLPATVGFRCNPQQKEVAEEVLRAWKETLLLQVSQAATKF